MSWRLAEADLENIRNRTDLVALVRSRGVELAQDATGDFSGRCPFHVGQDQTNFSVTPATGMWFCRDCGRTGNVIQFVEQHDGISFRHALDLLRQGTTAAFSTQPRQKQSTVPKLPCPLDVAADDPTLLNQVVGYYHERLKQSPLARTQLTIRGLDKEEVIDHFQLGFADRSLGLRLPEKNRREGQQLRSRLTQLGLWRESGHEHFNGCLVAPLRNETSDNVSLYGQRLQKAGLKSIYPPGLPRGLFNRECFKSPEIILCGTLFDALTFWVDGFKNVTCRLGSKDLTDELWQALRHLQRVRLAYAADDTGEQAAQRDIELFQKHGIEVFRIQFPQGMDANRYTQKEKSSGKSLATLVNSAAWLGQGKTSVVMSNGHVPDAAATLPPPTSPPARLEQQGDAWFLDIETREYRVTGLETTGGTNALKIALRLRHGENFHLDQVDLCRDTERRRFVERAAEETGLTADLLKRDLGKLLLAVEQEQMAILKPPEMPTPLVALSPEEREAALQWLRAPNLIERLREAFLQVGIIGEENNVLVAYLAGVSRKLEHPLAILIQSASAAGKTTLMDAVLSFFPEEDRVKYSAMTGQSLYYLGEKNLKHKILAVVEEAGAEKASYALKLLQSEGELTIASTGKDPQTGKLVTQEYHLEGPVMLFLTTTAINLDEELQNRCLTLAVDESAEQTGRIHRLQREQRTLSGLRARVERQDILKKLRNAQRLLTTMDVLNPYAPNLTFATTRTRNRRDHEKYLTLIDAIALLHQHQREAKVLPHEHHPHVPDNAKKYIEVTLDDIALANQLAPDVLGRSLDEIPPQTRRLLGYIREVLAHGHHKAKAVRTFTRKELRDHCGWSLTQVRIHLSRLVELECLAIRHGRLGSQFVYEMLLDTDTPEAVAHIGLIDTAKLRHDCKTSMAANLTGFPPGVAGQNGHLTAGGKVAPPPKISPPASLKPQPDGLTQMHIRGVPHQSTAVSLAS